MNKRILLLFIFCSCVLLFIGVSPAVAVPIIYDTTSNPGGQDPMTGPWTHELGNGFPINELISSSWEPTFYVPCPRDYLGGTNIKVTMTNLTSRAWTNVAYVKDPETNITNDDLLRLNGQRSFTIDWVGSNTPLIYESITVDTIFEPGETWCFVLQDYGNTLSLPASLFGSWDSVLNIGRVGNQSGGDLASSGSIIAVPEPATLSLLVIGGLALLRRNRK